MIAIVQSSIDVSQAIRTRALMTKKVLIRLATLFQNFTFARFVIKDPLYRDTEIAITLRRDGIP